MTGIHWPEVVVWLAVWAIVFAGVWISVCADDRHSARIARDPFAPFLWECSCGKSGREMTRRLAVEAYDNHGREVHPYPVVTR